MSQLNPGIHTVPALLILLSRGGAAKCTSPCQDCEIFHKVRQRPSRGRKFMVQMSKDIT